ncbi:MAG: dienelactone hydrolase family protein, partial [Acidimicrobiia bacterium]
DRPRMAELVLFHHAQGLTPGVHTFAADIRAAGHVVHVPDLYDGTTFADLDDGVGYAQKVGFDTIIERGRAAAEALLFHAAIPLSEFGGTWPDGVPFQIHTMEADEWGDVDVAHDLESIEGAELFLYPGDRHLFADNSLPDYNEGAATLLRQRVLSFLGQL